MDHVNTKTEQRTTQRVDVIGLHGALEKAWEQTFPEGLHEPEPCILIVWHAGWIYPHKDWDPWRDLEELLQASEAETRVAVLIFEGHPDQLGPDDPNLTIEASALRVILQAIAADADPQQDLKSAWVSVSRLRELLRSGSTVSGKQSTLKRLAQVCSAICEVQKEHTPDYKGPRPSIYEFFRFISNPEHFRTESLHDKPQDAVEGLRLLKWLASYVFVPHEIPLNILLVENNPGEFSDPAKNAAKDLRAIDVSVQRALGEFAFGLSPLTMLEKATIWLIREDFNQIPENRVSPSLWKRVGPEDPVFSWGQIDLVIQDIALGSNITGLDLVHHYVTFCPQALVFLLTSLDVETLVGSGDVDWNYVDCTIAKGAIATLLYEYRRCFREKFGRMFWCDWGTVSEGREFSGRQSLIDLFGSLHRWQIEPSILGHGQGVPEMIDHAERHIWCLWRLTDDVLGEQLENVPGYRHKFQIRERMTLALAVWLHDTGHRGDEYFDHPADVRSYHAGISERLLLRNPEAYGLEWLLRYCENDCGQNGEHRLRTCRNREREHSELPCPLRSVGLLCRHHQSNAPLTEKDLESIQDKGKSISPYSRVRPALNDTKADYETQLQEWTQTREPLVGWCGSDVRVFSHFTDAESTFFHAGGLLRMLDGIQVHRKRVGSFVAKQSYTTYLANRFDWSARQIRLLDPRLRETFSGSREWGELLQQREKLELYKSLVCIQYIHYLRQLAVHDVFVRWRWMEDGNGAIEVGLLLDEAGLREFSNQSVNRVKEDWELLRNVITPLNQDFKADKKNGWAVSTSDQILQAFQSHQLRDVIECWSMHVLQEFIHKEHQSQAQAGRPYLACLARERLRITLLGTDLVRLPQPVTLFEAHR